MRLCCTCDDNGFLEAQEHEGQRARGVGHGISACIDKHDGIGKVTTRQHWMQGHAAEALTPRDMGGQGHQE